MCCKAEREADDLKLGQDEILSVSQVRMNTEGSSRILGPLGAHSPC
jgi:hypothetical protein